MDKKHRKKEGDEDKYFLIFVSLFLWKSPLYDNLHVARNRFLKETAKLRFSQQSV